MRITLYYEAGTELPDPPTLYDSEERQAIVDLGIRVSLQSNKRDHVKDWFDAKAVRRVQELGLSIGYMSSPRKHPRFWIRFFFSKQ
jgi:hypothetical protein